MKCDKRYLFVSLTNLMRAVYKYGAHSQAAQLPQANITSLFTNENLSAIDPALFPSWGSGSQQHGEFYQGVPYDFYSLEHILGMTSFQPSGGALTPMVPGALYSGLQTFIPQESMLNTSSSFPLSPGYGNMSFGLVGSSAFHGIAQVPGPEDHFLPQVNTGIGGQEHLLLSSGPTATPRRDAPRQSRKSMPGDLASPNRPPVHVNTENNTENTVRYVPYARPAKRGHLLAPASNRKCTNRGKRSHNENVPAQNSAVGSPQKVTGDVISNAGSRSSAPLTTLGNARLEPTQEVGSTGCTSAGPSRLPAIPRAYRPRMKPRNETEFACRIEKNGGPCNVMIPVSDNKKGASQHVRDCHQDRPTVGTTATGKTTVKCGWLHEDGRVCAQATTLANLGRHILDKHDPGSKAFCCVVEGCNYECHSRMDRALQHVRDKHPDLL
ncbi:hypothetical protein AcV7_007507 [Taiwanofungus camphoratus]|nr:hypothetical protein AcV7_007507 [Antrodia cinnamomea]